jgi:acetyltransferase-like isoleucine patch superfamily enzyme
MPEAIRNRDFRIIGTCSLDNPKNACLTFATSEDYLKKAFQAGVLLEVLVPESLCLNCLSVPRHINITFEKEHIKSFIIRHNLLNHDVPPMLNDISKHSLIHPMACIGNEGMRYESADGVIISMKHMGNVVIKDGVVIGPFSSIARATLDSTIIEEEVKIGAGCQIGHNAKIGKRTLIIDGTVVLGSAHIFNDCYIGGNSVIRGNIYIAPNNLIGMGSVVTKSIDDSFGIYFGNPAKKMGEWDGIWPA